MTERIIEFLSNLLKIGKEQLFLKSGILRSKVPIKPVLGLTGLGVLFMAVRPLLSGSNGSEPPGEPTMPINLKPKPGDEYDLQKTLYLMKEKEKQLRQQEQMKQKS